MMVYNLKEVFEEIRKEFFPEWNNDGEWIIVEEPRLFPSVPGTCNQKTRQILIRHTNRPFEELQTLIIHEICHAVTNDMDHGEKWLDRMSETSKKAEIINKLSLSNSIKKDDKDNSGLEGINRTIDCVNSVIEQLIQKDPTMSYDDCMNYISIRLGTSGDDLKNSFPQCEEYYNRVLVRISGFRNIS